MIAQRLKAWVTQISRSVNFIEPRLTLLTICNALFQQMTAYNLYLPTCSKTKAEDKIVFVTYPAQYLLQVNFLK